MQLQLPLSLILVFKAAPLISTCGLYITIPCFDKKLPWNLSRAEKAPTWSKATSSHTHFVHVKNAQWNYHLPSLLFEGHFEYIDIYNHPWPTARDSWGLQRQAAALLCSLEVCIDGEAYSAVTPSACKNNQGPIFIAIPKIHFTNLNATLARQ